MSIIQIIKDEQELVDARNKSGYSIQVYDDGFGPLWLYQGTFGPQAVVRAQSFQDAYECVLDEILDPIGEDEVPEAYGFLLFSNTAEGTPLPNKGDPVANWVDIMDADTCNWLARSPDRETAMKGIYKAVSERGLELREGYRYQPNATGTGIVCPDDNESLTELTINEMVVQDLSIDIAEDDRVWTVAAGRVGITRTEHKTDPVTNL